MALELLTVGEAFEDIVFSGLPRLPELGEELRTDQLVRTIGGGVVITAVAGARAGLRCAVMSGLSDDAASFLKKEGIAVTNLKKANELHAVSVALSTRRDRSFVTCDGVNEKLQPRLIEALVGAPKARHVHFALGPKKCAAWLPVLAALRERGATTSWDFGWHEKLPKDPHFKELIAALDVLFVNEREATHFSGEKTVEKAAAFYRKHCKLTVIKLGAEGSRWISRALDLYAKPPKVKVVDTTGAGDAYNGGFLAGWLKGAPPEESLKRGNLLGALSTRAAGGLDGLPQKDQLE